MSPSRSDPRSSVSAKSQELLVNPQVQVGLPWAVVDQQARMVGVGGVALQQQRQIRQDDRQRLVSLSRKGLPRTMRKLIPSSATSATPRNSLVKVCRTTASNRLPSRFARSTWAAIN